MKSIHQEKFAMKKMKLMAKYITISKQHTLLKQ